MTERLFLDTYFVQALLNRRDLAHARALALLPRVAAAAEIVVTEAVLLEVANAMSRGHALRAQAATLIASYSERPECTVVPVDTELLRNALALYAAHEDKTWGLTDCVSFVVMKRLGIRSALPGDRHFVQAGFDALMVAAAA